MNVVKPREDCFMGETAAALVLLRFDDACPQGG
jgi:hypothetical protein